jgi:hypothetical protein
LVAGLLSWESPKIIREVFAGARWPGGSADERAKVVVDEVDRRGRPPLRFP